MHRKQEKWRTRLIPGILFLTLVILALSGCTWQGIRGSGCILCDSAPSLGGSVLTAPSAILVNPPVRFDGSAMVSLDGTLRKLRGEIFQALQSACGITHAEAKDKYGWPTAPAHDYGIEMWVSTSWDAGISVVSVNVMISRLHAAYQRHEYVFIKSGTASVTYGESYSAYGAHRVGMYRNADAATRFAAVAAIVNLCGGNLSHRPRADIGIPQEVPASCVPPGCYEETISLYGTWGGTGINSYGSYGGNRRHNHHHHHHNHSGKRRHAFPSRNRR